MTPSDESRQSAREDELKRRLRGGIQRSRILVMQYRSKLLMLRTTMDGPVPLRRS